jgi:two-component system, NtrC family, response regulator AtoC
MRLLVVSHDMEALRRLWPMVESNCWQLETANSAWEALERVQSGLAPHLLILDMPRGDRDSLHIVRWLRRLRPELPTILLCHAADADTKKDAIRMGANDVLVHPLQDDHLEFVIYRYLVRSTGVQRSEAVSENIEPLGENGFFVNASPLMQRLRAQVELLAQADVPVLIIGEKGSGKKTVARLIHKLSVRSGFKFLRVNGSALPGELLEREVFGVEMEPPSGPSQSIPGRFEIAEKGTILFEEVTDLPNNLQAKLVGVLQARSFARCGSNPMLPTDVRILATTSVNVERALAETKLREDLYYRLSAFSVHVPPLRQRKEEIRVLLQHFMHCLAKHYGLPAREFSPQVVEACEKYWWPGNVGQLETFVKRYLVAGDHEVVLTELNSREGTNPSGHNSVGVGVEGLAAEGLEQTNPNPQSLRSLVQGIKSETERNAIGLALEKTGWNRKAAARLLQVSYRALLYKIEQYHIGASQSFLSSLPGGQLPGAGNKGKAS